MAKLYWGGGQKPPIKQAEMGRDRKIRRLEKGFLILVVLDVLVEVLHWLR